jgi:hypothetical protein
MMNDELGRTGKEVSDTIPTFSRKNSGKPRKT